MSYAVIAFDFNLMQPGCVLLQVAMGGYMKNGGNPANDFPTESWLVAPTKDMKLYSIDTEERYRNIVDNYNRRWKMKKRHELKDGTVFRYLGDDGNRIPNNHYVYFSEKRDMRQPTMVGGEIPRLSRKALSENTMNRPVEVLWVPEEIE